MYSKFNSRVTIWFHLYFGKSLNPLKTSNLEVLEVLDRFRGIRTLEGLEVLRDISPGCSTGVQLKQFYTSIVISQRRVKRELRVPWLVEEQNATKQKNLQARAEVRSCSGCTVSPGW